MTPFRFLRFLIHPAFVAGAFALLLLVANLVPRAQVGLPVFLSPDSQRLPPCNGALEFGWPKTARVDEFIQFENVAPSPHYSLSHLLYTQRFTVQRTQQSGLVHLSNLAFCCALVLLSASGLRFLKHRRCSLNALLSIVTLIAILLGSHLSGDSVSKTDDLKASLSWYTAEK